MSQSVQCFFDSYSGHLCTLVTFAYSLVNIKNPGLLCLLKKCRQCNHIRPKFQPQSDVCPIFAFPFMIGTTLFLKFRLFTRLLFTVFVYNTTHFALYGARFIFYVHVHVCSFQRVINNLSNWNPGIFMQSRKS